MRILLVAPCFPPYPSSASLRTHGFARAWQAAGHAVTVLTTAKADDHRTMPLDVRGLELVELPVRVPGPLRWMRERTRRHRPEPIGVAAPPSSPGPAPEAAPGTADGGVDPAAGAAERSVGLPARGLGELRERTGMYSGARMPDLTDRWVGPAAAWARAQAAERGPWDLLVTSAGPYTAHLVGLRLRGTARPSEIVRAWIADYRDLWTDNELFPGLPVVGWYERRLEDRCLRRTDAVTTVSDGLAAVLRTRTDAPVAVIYNGFDAAELSRLDPAPVLPADDHVRLVFTGRLYERRQDPTAFVKAVARLRRVAPEIGHRIRLTVAGHDAGPWHRVAERHGVTDLVEPLGWVSREASLRLQRDADALLHVEWSDREAGVLTAKLFEYLAAGPPILVVGGDPRGDGPIGTLVRETGRGTVLGRDRDRIAGELRRLVAARRAAGSVRPRGPLRPDPARAATRRDARLARFERGAQAMQVLELAARCPSG